MATLDSYSSAPQQKISILGRIVDALGSDVSVASINGNEPSSWKPFTSIWAVGTVRNSLTTHFSIFTYLNGVCSGQLPVCLVVWTGSS